MPITFEHVTQGQRVLFGAGRAGANLAAEVGRLGARSPFVVAADRHLALLEEAGLGSARRYGRPVEHVPVETADDARAEAMSADLLIAVGGGSATGLAKAIALTSGLPIIAVPTTFAGSEATDVWGLTEGGQKRTGVDARVLPRTVVYDADLFATLSPEFAVASGLNAIAHCVDSLWGPRADPINAALAGEGLRALATGLPVLASANGIEQALYGCYLAAVAFASAGSGLHHKICHVLGGAYNLPHAATHAIVLPYVLAFNAPDAPAAAARIAAALDADDAVSGLNSLRRQLDAPRALRDYGLGEGDLVDAVEEILPQVPASNPRPVDRAALLHLLELAWSGREPRLGRTEDTA